MIISYNPVLGQKNVAVISANLTELASNAILPELQKACWLAPPQAPENQSKALWLLWLPASSRYQAPTGNRKKPLYLRLDCSNNPH